MSLLSPAAIRVSRAALPAWRLRRGALVRTFEFDDFVAALRFVNAVGRAAEKAAHHPDIDIRWNRVTLALTTHDAGGLTELDFTLPAVATRWLPDAAERCGGEAAAAACIIRRDGLPRVPVCGA